MAIVVLTDNSTAVYALSKGYSPSFIVNTICNRIGREFPHLELHMRHIPGENNPADGLSGGCGELTVECWATAVALSREALNCVEYGGSTTAGPRPTYPDYAS
jgi:hypothetical protein